MVGRQPVPLRRRTTQLERLGGRLRLALFLWPSSCESGVVYSCSRRIRSLTPLALRPQQRVTASFPIAGLSVSPSPIKPYFSIFAHPLEYGLSVHVPPMATPVVSLPPVQREGQPPWTSTGLGVRCAEWRPGGGWLAVAGWDGKVSVGDFRSGANRTSR